MAIKMFICIFFLGLAVSGSLAQVTPAHCNLACPFNYAPVCASNDLTYSNECVMRSLSCVDDLGLTLKHVGECL